MTQPDSKSILKRHAVQSGLPVLDEDSKVEPVAWIDNIGNPHKNQLAYCWKPLGIIEPNTTTIPTSEYEKLTAYLAAHTAQAKRIEELEANKATLDAKLGQTSYDIGHEAGLAKQAEKVAELELANKQMREALTEIRQNNKLWKMGGIGGADQYQGLPPAMRIIDEALALPSTTDSIANLLSEAVKVERNECAKICDDKFDYLKKCQSQEIWCGYADTGSKICVEAIRARNEKG